MRRFPIVIAAIWLTVIVSCDIFSFDPREATIDSLHHDLYTGLTTCQNVVSSFLSRIEALNEKVNAIISLNPSALVIANELDASLRTGNTTGALFCIPILLKDNFDTNDLPTTGGNFALAQSRPSEDAPTVAALRKAGAIILGKTNLHELALEGISVSSLGGQTVNPYDKTRTPGGSSGGSGAAVAASFSVFATGTDTVNSLRSPASANNLFSVRPTRGLITRRGIMPISYTHDAVGPITRSVKDAAIALTVMASTGYDPTDNTTALVPMELHGKDYAASITSGSLRNLRFGIVEGFFDRTASSETSPVNDAMSETLLKLQAAGATIVSIRDPIYNATTILSTLDVQRYEYREEMASYLSRPSLGGAHPSKLEEIYSSSEFLVLPSQYEYVNTALVSSTSNDTYPIIKSGIANLSLALQNTFTSNNISFLLYPEQKNLVVRLGSPSQAGRNGILAALTGSPVVTVPIGFSPPTEDAPIGVPIGMEILGRPWSEEELLKVAWQMERQWRIRKIPRMAEVVVERKEYKTVPMVMPNRGEIPSAYPLGRLQI